MAENKPKVDWKPEDIFRAIHDDVQNRLAEGRTALKNPVTKGTASERTWIKLLRRYLPKRYRVASAHVIDSNGKTSHQLDAVIFDRHYSPPIFSFEKQLIIPAESVYAVFEIKQDLNKKNIRDAQKKVGSVRSLHRKCAPFFHMGELRHPTGWPKIIGGILTLDSKWKSDTLKSSLLSALKEAQKDKGNTRLDIGCIAARGYFVSDPALELDLFEGGDDSWFRSGEMSTTDFLFFLLSRLQRQGTVPAIDMFAYRLLLERSS